MIDAQEFVSILQHQGLKFFAGVPDSLLKDFCFEIAKLPGDEHMVGANEGSAIGLATGHYLATGKPGVVYLQNSGIGNCVNPLLSLADPKVYGIPMILIIGWRGEPGVKDEPQHVKQGEIMEAFLSACDLPYEVMPRETADVRSCIERLYRQCVEQSRPVILLVRKDSFAKGSSSAKESSEQVLSRETAIRVIAQGAPEQTAFVATTGHISRELYEYRKSSQGSHERDFLTVGSMGHCSQIALGIAQSTSRPVICLDGDGAALMHLGGLASLAAAAPSGYLHVILNNGVHGSVGGQPTTMPQVSFSALGKALGYSRTLRVTAQDELQKALADYKSTDPLTMIEVMVDAAARSDLGRPKETPRQNKQLFQEFLNRD